MVNIISKKCIKCKLSYVNRKYNNHGVFCFVNLFPNDPKSVKARSSKELKVVLHIK